MINQSINELTSGTADLHVILVGLFKKPEGWRQIRCYWKALCRTPLEWPRGQNLESTPGIDGLCVPDR